MSAVTELPVELACPKCQDPSSLATVEPIIGHAPIAVRLDAAGALQLESAQRTELDWDAATTAGVTCRRCFWTYEGENWPGQRQQVDEDPAERRGRETEVADGALYADACGRVWRAAENGLSDRDRIEVHATATGVVPTRALAAPRRGPRAAAGRVGRRAVSATRPVPRFRGEPDLTIGRVRYVVEGVGVLLLGPDPMCPLLSELVDEFREVGCRDARSPMPAPAEQLRLQYGDGDGWGDHGRTNVPVVHRVRLGGTASFAVDRVDPDRAWPWLSVQRFSPELVGAGDTPEATRRRTAQIVAALVNDYLTRDDVAAVRAASARRHAARRTAEASDHISRLHHAIAARQQLLSRFEVYRNEQRALLPHPTDLTEVPPPIGADR